MNFSPIYLGSVPNDRTGDTLRSGGMKINRNFAELYWVSAQRHRHSPLIYRQTGGFADYMDVNVTTGPGNWETSVSVTLLAPFTAAIGAGVDERGERNLSAVVSVDTTPSAWDLHHGGGAQANYTRYLYVERNFDDLVTTYGFTTVAPVTGQTEPTAPVTDLHWFDEMSSTMRRWNGTGWEVVYRLFIVTFLYSGPGPGDPVGSTGVSNFIFDWDNDEVREMKRRAMTASIIFGG